MLPLPIALAFLVAPQVASRAPDFALDVRPLLRDSCLDCHAGKEPDAKLSFEPFIQEGDAARAIGVWRRVRDRLEAGEMPPKGAPAADPQLLAAARRWLDTRLGLGTGGWPIDPGRVTLRRLNRAEYANTIRDLLGLDLNVTAKLPPDEVGYGFDNIGDVLGLPPLLLEKYAALAEEIAAAALPGEELRKVEKRRIGAAQLESTLKHYGNGEWFSLYASGAATAKVELPRAGEYVVRARVSGDQAGPDACQAELTLDGAPLLRREVKCESPENEEIEWRGTLGGGPRRAAVAFLNDYYMPDAPDPKQRDRNLLVAWIEVEGPLDHLPPTAGERRVWAGDPAFADRGSGGGGDLDGHVHSRACVAPALKSLASRAWRRPASDGDVARLVQLVDATMKAGDPLETAMQSALAALLVSPHFLFHEEIDPAPSDATPHALSSFELAARLSCFLWSSLPDERLTALAATGKLADPAVLAGEARRLLRDARAGALVDGFAAQWLQLRSLARVAPDPELFPGFDDALRDSMRRETELFFEAVLREGRPLRELLDADFTFLDERLAKHYGIDGVRGATMRRVPLDRGLDGRRGGILAQASLLTLTSNPTRTSPVKRGKFILERILGTPPPPPPPGVGVIDDSAQAAHAASLKERLAQHRAKPECATCHDKMDALGFALERYGPTGAWRDADGPHPIDDRGTLPDGRALAGIADLERILLDGDAFPRCVTEKLLTYALGRGPTDDDRRVVRAFVAGLGGRSPSFEELVVAITGFDAFRMRRGEKNDPKE